MDISICVKNQNIRTEETLNKYKQLKEAVIKGNIKNIDILVGEIHILYLEILRFENMKNIQTDFVKNKDELNKTINKTRNLYLEIKRICKSINKITKARLRVMEEVNKTYFNAIGLPSESVNMVDVFYAEQG